MCQITGMNLFDFAQVVLEGFNQGGGQDGDTILFALPIADDDLAVVKVYIFDA